MKGKQISFRLLWLPLFTCILITLGLNITNNHSEVPVGRVADTTAISSEYKPISEVASEAKEQPWGLLQIKAPEAWEMADGGKGVLVAVLDTGIDDSHANLAGKVLDKTNFSHSQGIDNTRGHGTHIAGIISAISEDNKITGVAYDSSLLDVQVADNDGTSNAERLARGIIWAVDNGAQVINISIVISKPYPLLEYAVNYAWDKDCIIVAAAGNDFSTKPVYPAAYPHVISVAATDQDDCLTKWSNYGDWVTVAAPGVDIYSTLPDNKYANKSGSSYSTALVTGEAALLYSRVVDTNHDSKINDEVFEIIESNYDKIQNAESPVKRVNAFKAAASAAIIAEASKTD